MFQDENIFDTHSKKSIYLKAIYQLLINNWTKDMR